MTYVQETIMGILITSDEKKAFIDVELPNVGSCKIRRCPFCGKHEFTITKKEHIDEINSRGISICTSLTCNECETVFKAEESSISQVGRNDYATNVRWMLRLWNHRARDNYG